MDPAVIHIIQSNNLFRREFVLRSTFSPSRRLLQDLFVTEADILPDADNKILRIKVHGASRPAANKSLRSLFEKLNEAEIIYPGSDMRLIYELGV